MNKTILFILLNSFVYLFAFELDSYDEALKLQKQNGKTIMMEVTRSDCNYCAKMAEIFADAKMSLWIDKHFIPVELNLDFDELPLGINVFATPSFFFIDKRQKIVKKIAGALSANDFKDLVKNIK